eukprot:5045883-Lingulodinium_polyedra.AAC.1
MSASTQFQCQLTEHCSEVALALGVAAVGCARAHPWAPRASNQVFCPTKTYQVRAVPHLLCACPS